MTKTTFKDEDLHDEIDLGIIFSILQRNKKFIFYITIIFSLLGSILSFSRKPYWQGGFDLKLRENIISNSEIKKYLYSLSMDLRENKNLDNKITVISNFLNDKMPSNIIFGKKNFDDQKSLINSQKVLIPVFQDFQKYDQENDQKYQLISFDKWKNDFLTIKSDKDNFILSVKYKNFSKDNISRTLDLIKDSYKTHIKKIDKQYLYQNIKYLEYENKFLKRRTSSPLNKLILSSLDEYLELCKISLKSEPWKYITKSNINFTFFGIDSFIKLIFIPFILVSLVVIIKEKTIGNIYEIEIFKKYIPYKLIQTIYSKDSKLISNIIKNTINLSSKDKLGVIYLTNQFNNKSDINIELKGSTLNLEFKQLDSIDEIKNFTRIILIAEIGYINQKNLKLISNYLILEKEKIVGWYIIDN